MINRMLVFTFAFFLLLNDWLHAQTVNEPKHNPEAWSKPLKPFRIAGDVYYVGTYDLACYFIVTDEGNILINTGLAGSLPQIKQNIADLGFRFSDIKILLTTQAHFDHLGAMAAIKKQTGAKFWADKAEADVLKSGGATDYELGRLGVSFEPLVPDSLLEDNAVVQLGNAKITLLHHPGHTKGSCSYLLTTQDEKRSYTVLIANMPSIIINKKFSEVTAYPAIEKDYAYTLNAMRKLKFDIWLASHASQFSLHTKYTQGSKYQPSAFFDNSGYIKSLDKLQQDFMKKQQE